MYLKRLQRFGIGIVYVTALLPYTSSAQLEPNTATSDQYTLDSVVVLSQGISIPLNKQNRNVQIFSAEELKKMPVNNLNELLALNSGIDIRQKGSGGAQADIGVDGGTFDQTLILINGVKMSDPQTGHNMLNLPLPLNAIQRIEILKGPASGVYGVNAMSGVINIVTKSGMDAGALVRLYSGSSFKSDDSTGKTYINYGIQALYGFNTRNWKHMISAGLDQGNGYRYNSAYQNIKAIYTLNGSVSEGVALEFMAGYAEHEFGANSFYAAPADIESEEKTKNLITALKMPIRLSPVWTIKPYLSFRYGFDDYIFVRQDPSVFRNIHHTYTYDGGADNTWHTSIGTFGLGLFFRNESISSTNLGERSRTNLGANLAWFKSWNRMDLHAGIFFNQNKVYGFKAYPSLDFGYKVNDAFRLFFNAGIGQRLPTFTDLYYHGPSNLGNENLLPEMLTTVELGMKYQKNGWTGQLSLMYKYGQDFIDWVRSDTTQPWQVMNFQTLHTTGVNFDLQKRFDFSSRHHLNIYTGYTYLFPELGEPSDPDNASLISRYAINCLQHQWVFRASATIADNIQLGLSNRLIYRYDAPNISGQPRRSGYDLVDLRLAYHLSKFTVGVDINNLLDVSYIESGVVPLPGRWYTLSLNWKIQ